MIKKLPFLVVLIFAMLVGCIYTKAETNNINNLVVSNRYFSFTMPEDTKGTYIVSKEDENNAIYICEKISMESNMDGCAFGVAIFKSPSEYADTPGNKKLGELTTKKGVVYDLVLLKAREIYYGEGKEVEKNFNRLYDTADKIEVKGINGNKYVKGKGMKGEDLYGAVLKKYKKAFVENWTEDKKYEDAGMGYMYYYLAKGKINMLDNVGYAYYDVNDDGIDELLIGGIYDDGYKGVIFDLYTMVNRKPTLVFSGDNSDNAFFVCNNNFICNEYSESEKYETRGIYSIEQNSATMNILIRYIYDENANKKNPWFMSVGLSDERKSVKKKDVLRDIKIYNDYKKFDYIPFSQVK